jgi:hypothetical protein
MLAKSKHIKKDKKDKKDKKNKQKVCEASDEEVVHKQLNVQFEKP